MVYFYYILTLVLIFLMGFMIGAVCGVKAQKREVEKMVHRGVLYLNNKLYEVEEKEDKNGLQKPFVSIENLIECWKLHPAEYDAFCNNCNQNDYCNEVRNYLESKLKRN